MPGAYLRTYGIISPTMHWAARWLTPLYWKLSSIGHQTTSGQPCFVRASSNVLAIAALARYQVWLEFSGVTSGRHAHLLREYFTPNRCASTRTSHGTVGPPDPNHVTGPAKPCRFSRCMPASNALNASSLRNSTESMASGVKFDFIPGRS